VKFQGVPGLESRMEKLVLLCLLIGIISVLAEFAPRMEPRQKAGVPASSSPPVSG
jgi:hypothetical protein